MREFKIFEVKREKTYEKVEAFLQEKYQEGWELDSMTVDVSKDIRGVVVLAMHRDK